MDSHVAARGTAGDDVLVLVRGGAFAFGGDDTITAIAQDNLTQIHTYAADGDDLTYLDFAAISGFAHGHHVRGGAGEDVFHFTDIDNVSGFVVGRIEDFDIRSDTILIEGETLDFADLPDNVRVVGYNGHHDDPGALPQPWLHISTEAGGDIFYALEGARVDMDQEASQEPHFLKAPVDPWALPEIEYVSPNNYLPDGHAPVNGLVIEDTDATRADVLENIFASDLDDLIAAGLNDDTVYGGGGHDNIFAGSGNDVVYGGPGADRIEGATGNDVIDGGSGVDDLTGGEGEDLFVFADFDRGFDVIRDFVPGTDKIVLDHEGMDWYDDLRFIRYFYENTPSLLVRFVGADGVVDRSMGGIVLKGVVAGDLSESDFLFGDPLTSEETPEPPPEEVPEPPEESPAPPPEEVPEPPPEEPPAPPPEETPEPPPEETPEPPPEETPEPPPEETPEPPPEETPEPPPEETPEPPPEETPEPPPEETPEPPPEETPEPPPEETPEPPPEETPEPPPEETPEPPPEETPEPPPEDTGDEGAPPVNPILGTQGSDRLPGTDGMDLLYGLSGDDTMDGDAGRDLIDGGAGRDDLTGGEGGDWFVFADFDLGFDVVRDFVPGTDQIVLDHEDMQSIDDLGVFRFFYEDTPSAIVGFIGENGMMDRSMGGIILKGIRPGDLTEADFIFEDALPPELVDEAASDDLDGADVIAALFIRYEDRDALMDAASGIDDDGMAEASDGGELSPV
jgi:hypothetical protein